MPAVTETVVTITCDNAACPGNDLDTHDRTGWLFVSTEVYGQASESHVFCCTDCAAAKVGSE